MSRAYFVGVICWVGCFTSEAQEAARYWRAGGSSNQYSQGRFSGSYQNRYRNESRGVRGNGTSRYQDRFDVESGYEGRNREKRVASGGLSESGESEREYFHGNDPERMERIEKAEGNRRKINDEFVDFTRSTQDSVVRNQLRKSELQSSPYTDRALQQRAQESADWAIQSAGRQQEIMRQIRKLKLEMFGTAE